MKIEADPADDAIRRLRRIEGQVAGIARMIASGRDCKDVITQISAASRAMDQVGFKLVASGMKQCLTAEAGTVDPDAEAELERMFLKLG